MFTYNGETGDELPIFSTGMIGQYAHGNEQVTMWPICIMN